MKKGKTRKRSKPAKRQPRMKCSKCEYVPVDVQGFGSTVITYHVNCPRCGHSYKVVHRDRPGAW
jgi:ribosomal protein S27AE